MTMRFKTWCFELELIELAVIPSQWWEILDQRIGQVPIQHDKKIMNRRICSAYTRIMLFKEYFFWIGTNRTDISSILIVKSFRSAYRIGAYLDHKKIMNKRICSDNFEDHAV